MRSEAEMLDLILTFARGREDIRVVVMNGSLVNPTARKDPFQDYDIACYVANVDAFRGDMNIPRYFGELMILQLPDEMGDPEPESEGSYAYLMQFMDGNRIDLSFHPLDRVAEIQEDSLSSGAGGQRPACAHVAAAQRPQLLAQVADRQSL